MAAWIWVLIPLAAIVGAFIIEYQKTKMNMRSKNRQNQQDLDEIRKLVGSLKKRIENLEAIAAGDPGEFATGSEAGMTESEIPDEKEENRKKVSDWADKTRTQS